MLALQRLTNEYIASIRKTLRAAKQDDCSRLLRLREQQTHAIFFRNFWFYRCPIPTGSLSPSVADCKNGVGVRMGW